MPLCTLYAVRIILMTVISIQFSKQRTTHFLAAAAPFPNHPEGRAESIESASPGTVSYESEQLSIEQRRSHLHAGGNKRAAALKNDDPSVPSPSTVQLAFINISSVLITWTYPTSDHTHFIVQMSYDGDAYRNVSELLSLTSFVYSGLKYSAYYQFRVIAYVNGVASVPTDTKYFVNGVTAPPGPPVNVMAILMSYDVISLQWDAPNTPSPLLYLVHWGISEGQLDREKTIAQSTHVSFSDLELDHTYYFSVTADINGWLSVPSPIATAVTPPPSLPAVVVKLTVADKWTLIGWTLPTVERIPNEITQLNVYTDFLGNHIADNFNNTEAYTNVYTVEPIKRTFNLTGLDPGTQLVVGVAYLSGSYRSELSSPVLLETFEEVMCGSCAPVSSTKLKIEWQVRTALNKTRTVQVFDQLKGTILSQVRTHSIAGEIVVPNLRPWTSYSLAVALETTSADIQRNLCPSLNCWTKEDAPSQPPVDVRASTITSRSVTLSWSQPPTDSQNGILTKYTIGYECTPRYSTQDCNTRQLDTVADKPLNLSLTIDTLTPFTSYSFVIAASTRAGMGPFSFPLTVSTMEEAPDAPPTNITINDITITSFNIRWTPPSPAHQNGRLNSYSIFLSKLPSNNLAQSTNYKPLKFERSFSALPTHNQKPFTHHNAGLLISEGAVQTRTKTSTIVHNGTGTEVKVDGLVPNTKYMVQVSANTEAGSGPLSDAVFVSTRQSGIVLITNLNFTTTLSDVVKDHTCFDLMFMWSWPSLLSNSTLLTDNVTVVTWNISIRYRTEDKENIGMVPVGENTHITELTLNGFNGTKERNVSFWLEFQAVYSNGSELELRSGMKCVLLPFCALANGEWKIAVIVGAGITLTCTVMLAFAICCGCLVYQWKKRHHASTQSALLMDNFHPPESEANDYLLLDPTIRVSDGRSSTSSTEEESVRTSMESLNSATNNSVQTASDTDSEILNLTAVIPPNSALQATENGMSELLELGGQPKGYVINLDSQETECKPHGALPLAPRQNPDGCSLSSATSSESLALSANEQPETLALLANEQC